MIRVSPTTLTQTSLALNKKRPKKKFGTVIKRNPSTSKKIPKYCTLLPEFIMGKMHIRIYRKNNPFLS